MSPPLARRARGLAAALTLSLAPFAAPASAHADAADVARQICGSPQNTCEVMSLPACAATENDRLDAATARLCLEQFSRHRRCVVSLTRVCIGGAAAPAPHQLDSALVRRRLAEVLDPELLEAFAVAHADTPLAAVASVRADIVRRAQARVAGALGGSASGATVAAATPAPSGDRQASIADSVAAPNANAANPNAASAAGSTTGARASAQFLPRASAPEASAQASDAARASETPPVDATASLVAEPVVSEPVVAAPVVAPPVVAEPVVSDAVASEAAAPSADAREDLAAIATETAAAPAENQAASDVFAAPDPQTPLAVPLDAAAAGLEIASLDIAPSPRRRPTGIVGVPVAAAPIAALPADGIPVGGVPVADDPILSGAQGAVGEPALSTAELNLATQQELNRIGIQIGRPDGVWGPRSRSGLRLFQTRSGRPATGEPSAADLIALRAAPSISTTAAAPPAADQRSAPTADVTETDQGFAILRLPENVRTVAVQTAAASAVSDGATPAGRLSGAQGAWVGFSASQRLDVTVTGDRFTAVIAGRADRIDGALDPMLRVVEASGGQVRGRFPALEVEIGGAFVAFALQRPS